jgi:hypothetical protein
MKSLHAKEKVVQAQKIARHDQLDPLQEKVKQLVMDIDIVKIHIEQIGLEGGEILIPSVTVHMVESMVKKRNQAHKQCQQMEKMYEALAQVVKYVGVHE